MNKYILAISGFIVSGSLVYLHKKNYDYKIQQFNDLTILVKKQEIALNEIQKNNEKYNKDLEELLENNILEKINKIINVP